MKKTLSIIISFLILTIFSTFFFWHISINPASEKIDKTLLKMEESMQVLEKKSGDINVDSLLENNRRVQSEISRLLGLKKPKEGREDAPEGK